MKKVLFIAYVYPPVANSGTQRNLKFANHLPDHDWEPIVLTVADEEAKNCDHSLLDEVRPGTRIERAPLWSNLAARIVADAFSALVDRDRVTTGLGWRIRRLWQVPDECVSWFPTAVRLAERIYRQKGFDAIYASGWPWTTFLVAREVGRRTGRPYVLDYRDLWKITGTMAWETQTLLQEWLGPRLERPVLRDAAAVVTVTPSLVRMLESSAGEGKVTCITNGFDPDDFARATAPATMDRDQQVRVVYTGVWRPGYDLDDLYCAVRQLKETRPECVRRLKVTVAGFSPGHAQDYGLKDVIEELGPVSHSRAVDLMLCSSVLYLPVPKGYYAKASLPGKLFEYLGTGRPILASIPPDSDVATVLASVGGALCVAPGDVSKLAEVLETLCSSNGAVEFSARIPNALSQYTRSSLTKKLAEVLNSVVQSRA